MQRAARLFTCLMALGSAGASAVPEAAPHAVAADLANTRMAGELARAQAARARDRAAQLDREARSATEAGDAARLRAAALAAQVQQQEAAVAVAEADQAQLVATRRDLSQRLARKREPVARLMAGLQELTARPPLFALLQPGSLENTVHLRAVVAAIGPQIRERTAALQAEVVRARAMEHEAVQLAANRRGLQADLDRKRRDLLALAAQEQLRAQRAAGSADREAERAFAMAEQARTLSGLVRRLESASAGARRDHEGVPAAEVASFAAPVIGPVEQADGNSDRAGVIIFLPASGAAVVAPRAGRVAFAGAYRGYGTVVILEHDGGWTSLLTGLASAQVAVGQRLAGGAFLGRAPLRAPAIGLELRRGGAPVAARRFLR